MNQIPIEHLLVRWCVHKYGWSIANAGTKTHRKGNELHDDYIVYALVPSVDIKDKLQESRVEDAIDTNRTPKQAFHMNRNPGLPI